MRFTIHDGDGRPIEVALSGQRLEDGKVVADVVVGGTGTPEAVTLATVEKPAVARSTADTRKTPTKKAAARKAPAKRAAASRSTDKKAPVKKAAKR